MATLPTPQRDLVTAVEFDLMNGSAIETLRLCDVGPVLGASSTEATAISASFRPCLYVPIEISSRIVSDGLSDVMPSSGDSGGTIKFSLRDSRPGGPNSNPPIWQYLDMGWLGRHIRIYTGEANSVFSEYELSYVGRVDDITHDTLDVEVKTASVSIDLDDVLVPFLFDTFAIISGDSGVPDVLLGKPLPELRGTRYNIPAILVSDTDFGAPLYYQVSRLALFQIMEVRVGGIPWDEVALNPEAGQWAPILGAGAFVLGGITGGLDVRCDARGVGWEFLTTAKLMTDLITEAGGEVDDVSMAQLATDAPHLIGWWTGTDSVNRLDAFNQIMAGVGGWWTAVQGGKYAAGVYNRAGPISFTDEFESPVIMTHAEESDFLETEADIVLRDNVVSIQLSRTLPPVWRVRVEHTHNDGPLTSFADAVRELDQQVMKEEGIVSEPWEDRIFKIKEPRAVDLPVIKSLVNTEGDARFIRDRIASVFGLTRHIYDVKAYVDQPPLYGFAFVDYMMVHGFYRILSFTRGYGGGPATMQIWG